MAIKRGGHNAAGGIAFIGQQLFNIVLVAESQGGDHRFRLSSSRASIRSVTSSTDI